MVHGSGATSVEDVAFAALLARKNLLRVFEFFVQNKDLTEEQAVDGLLNVMFRNASSSSHKMKN